MSPGDASRSGARFVPEIRRMRAEEFEQTVAVWERSRWDAQPWLEERMSWAHESNLGHFRDVVTREFEVWVAIDAGEVVGLLAVGDGRVDQLYVDPPHQGRGVGSALLDQARRLHPAGLTLFTHQRNERARGFYESRGFRVVRLGISPPPESEPDVEYAWAPLP
jgi:ribosomal protein S18 acetylase RimI-like enzyme